MDSSVRRALELAVQPFVHWSLKIITTTLSQLKPDFEKLIAKLMRIRSQINTSLEINMLYLLLALLKTFLRAYSPVDPNKSFDLKKKKQIHSAHIPIWASFFFLT